MLKIDNLEQSLRKANKEKMRLSRFVTTSISEHSESEAIFLECIKQVKKEIEKRLNWSKEKEYPPKEEFFSNITLKQFLSSDKNRILELLLSSEKFLTKIYDVIFPGKNIPLNVSTINHEDAHSMLNTSELLNNSEMDIKPGQVDLNQTYDVGHRNKSNPRKIKFDTHLFRISNGKLLKKPN